MEVVTASGPGTLGARQSPRALDDLTTVGRAFVTAMRHHQRAAALREVRGGRWDDTPDWRLDRQVIRLGLYLRERAKLAAGEPVAIVSPLRREALIAEWASMLQGAVPTVIDPEAGWDAVREVLATLAPRVLFTADGSALEKLRGAGPSVEGARLIAFADPRPGEEGALFSEVVDLGGTLDTAERAGSFRAQAREVAAGAAALLDVVPGRNGAPEIRSMTHAEVVAHLRRVWSADRARVRDVAYVAAGAPDLAARLAVLAYVTDGTTTTVLGTPGHEAEELAALQPQHVAAPVRVLETALARCERWREPERDLRDWMRERAGFLGRLMLGGGAEVKVGRGLRRVRVTRGDGAGRLELRAGVPVDVDG